MTYSDDLPQVSVVFIFVNEALSVILRSVHSVVNHTPPQLLKEVILVDDNSDNGEWGQRGDACRCLEAINLKSGQLSSPPSPDLSIIPNGNSVPTKHSLPLPHRSPCHHHLLAVPMNRTPPGTSYTWRASHSVCPFVTGLCHSAPSPQGLSVLCQVLECPSFLRLCGWTGFSRPLGTTPFRAERAVPFAPVS